MCFHSKPSSLIHCWFTNIELIPNSNITHARTKLIWHTYISLKAYHSLLFLRNTRQHLSATLGGHFKQKNYQQQKNVKNVALNRPQKELIWKKKTLVCSMRTKVRKKAECYHACSTSTGNVSAGQLKNIHCLCPKMTTLYWLLDTNILASMQFHTYGICDWWGLTVHHSMNIIQS